MRRISLREKDRDRMKRLTTQEILSLVGIAIASPVLAMGILVSARAAAMGGNDFLLFALALCGAVVSGINGFGRRTIKAKCHVRGGHRGPQPKVALHS